MRLSLWRRPDSSYYLGAANYSGGEKGEGDARKKIYLF